MFAITCTTCFGSPKTFYPLTFHPVNKPVKTLVNPFTHPYCVSEMGSSISVFGHTSLLQIGVKSKINNNRANRVDPDETAHYESFNLDLHPLLGYTFGLQGQKVAVLLHVFYKIIYLQFHVNP